MSSKRTTLDLAALQGLTPGAPQVLGAIRLVPLLRAEVREDLRLGLQRYGEEAAVVDLGGGKGNAARAVYCSYVPHGLVVSWGTSGQAAAVYGGRLSRRDGKRFDLGACSVRVMARMVRRDDAQRLRFLPLHLALEGYLALQFNGPDRAWSEYSDHALRRGLTPRRERVTPGRVVEGLADALRGFEIHPGQCGVLVFVADALASAFVVPHPEDYRRLHRSLLEDVYGDLIARYAGLYDQAGDLTPPWSLDGVETLDGLRSALAEVRAAWATQGRELAGGLFRLPLEAQRIYRLGAFELLRFLPTFALDGEAHVGECILRDDGTLEYLKTFRLTAAQTRRAFLLRQLAEHRWDLEATAAGLGTTHAELVLRLERAGFGYLLKPHVLEAARRRR
ncbi:MAG: hypothetical protein R3F62_11630 [Planctomycetota bacterium]